MDHSGVNLRRVRHLNALAPDEGPVIYWMHRDQRVHDNWALLFAQALAHEQKVPLIVAYCLDLKAKGATQRQYDFMLKGLEHVEADLKRLNIHFFLQISSRF